MNQTEEKTQQRSSLIQPCIGQQQADTTTKKRPAIRRANTYIKSDFPNCNSNSELKVLSLRSSMNLPFQTHEENSPMLHTVDETISNKIQVSDQQVEAKKSRFANKSMISNNQILHNRFKHSNSQAYAHRPRVSSVDERQTQMDYSLRFQNAAK